MTNIFNNCYLTDLSLIYNFCISLSFFPPEIKPVYLTLTTVQTHILKCKVRTIPQESLTENKNKQTKNTPLKNTANSKSIY